MWRITLGICLVSSGLIAADVLAKPPTAINVEVDYMYTADHIHRLYQEEIDAVVQMFACQGITLTIEISDSIQETNPLARDANGSLFENNGIEPDQFLTIKNTYFNHLGQPGWHYCIMAHQYTTFDGEITGSSGFAEILGDDFIVTLGAWSDQVGYPIDRAGTFAHELGHNLGLLHTGDQPFTVFQYKPNYASVMAYRYQVWGVRAFMECNGLSDACHVVTLKSLDYSHGLLPDLDENALDERQGIGFGPTDWDCDGTIDAPTVSRDLSGDWDWCDLSGELTSIRDFDDWSDIRDVTFASSNKALENRESIACMSYEEALKLRAEKVGGCTWYPIPVTAEPCVQTPADDIDLDGIKDFCDNCPTTANHGQEDLDSNGVGDACQVFCACDCHADPGGCNGSQDIVDVVETINVAFRGFPAIPDPNQLCPRETTDVNCTGATDVVDVVNMVNVSFRGANAATEFCDPCL